MHFVCGTFAFLTFLVSSYSVVPDNKTSKFSVKFVVILPSVARNRMFQSIPYSLEKVLPAVNYSLEKCQKYLPGAKFILNYKETDGAPYEGPLAYLDMYFDKLADIFLGPVCLYELAQAARYGAHFGLPSMTATGYKKEFNKMRHLDYGTLTTLTGNFLKFVEMMTTVFRRFGFRKMGMIYHNIYPSHVACAMETSSAVCFQILKPLYDHFTQLNMTSVYSPMDDATTMVDIEAMLKKRQNDSRSKYFNVESNRRAKRL